MGRKTTFESLVFELDSAERSRLYDKLRKVAKISSEPLLQANAATRADRAGSAPSFKELGFITRLLISIRSLVSGIPREELVRENALSGIAKKVESFSPGYIEHGRRVLSEGFLAQVQALKDSSRYFQELLQKTMDRNKGSFYAFLASLEMEDIHAQLSTDADPYVFADRNALATASDVKVSVLSAFEEIMGRITEDQRRGMYADVRVLHFLRKLSVFTFDKFISSFTVGPRGRREFPYFSAVDYVNELSEILSSMAEPPSPKLMEALFAFVYTDEMVDENFDIEGAVKTQLPAAEKALSGIRAFNARVPLDLVLKLVNDDPRMERRSTAGGEDWFATLKAYWRDRIEKRLQRYLAERLVRELEGEIVQLVGPINARFFDYVSKTGSDTVPPVYFARAFSFLAAFYDKVFVADINKALKTILLDGEFYKRDNRLDFTDTYNTILQTGEMLRAFDRRLGPSGDLGMAYIQARTELTSIQLRRKKNETSSINVATEAETLLRRSLEAISRMQLIVKGLLTGDPRTKYDSLSNMNRLDGKANKDFLQNLEGAKGKLEKAAYLLSELMRAALSENEGA